jgi:hypothetical protein
MSQNMIPEVFAQKEDSPHTDGHMGVMMLGVRNHISGSTTDGDYSAVSVSSTGDMHTIGRRDVQRIQVTVSGTSTTAYTAGDQFGTLISLTNAVRVSGGSGVIVGVGLQSASDSIGPFDVVFFDSAPTLAADNAAFAISDTDILKVVGLVSLAGAYDLGANRICQAFNLAAPYVCSGSTTLYAALIIRSVATLVAGDLNTQLTVYVERN